MVIFATRSHECPSSARTGFLGALSMVTAPAARYIDYCKPRMIFWWLSKLFSTVVGVPVIIHLLSKEQMARKSSIRALIDECYTMHLVYCG